MYFLSVASPLQHSSFILSFFPHSLHSFFTMSWPKIRHRWRIPLLFAVAVLLVLQYSAFPSTDSSYANSGIIFNTDSHTECTHVPITGSDEVEDHDEYDPSKPHTPLQGVKGFRPRLPRIQRPKVEETSHAKSVREYRQKAVKDAFIHTWTGYSMFSKLICSMRTSSLTVLRALRKICLWA